MALEKTFLAIFVVALAFNSYLSNEARGSPVNSQFEFTVQDLASAFGIGSPNNNDCEDCDPEEHKGLSEFIQNQQVPKGKYVVPPSEALIKKLLYKLKSKRPSKDIGYENVKAKINEYRKPLTLQFLQSVILDCVKDVVSTVNSNDSLVDVDKEVLEKSREKVQKLLEKFIKELEQKFDAVKQALENIKDPKVVKDVEERIKDVITNFKIKIESLVQYFNGTSGKYDDQLKNVREIIRDSIKKFTEQIISSKCISVRKSNAAFCKCLEPIYIQFTCNLTKTIEKVDDLLKKLQVINREAIKYVEKTIENILKEVEEKAKEELENIEDLVQPNPQIDKEEFLKNKSEQALTAIKDVVGLLEKAKNDFDVQKKDAELSLEKALDKLKETQQILVDAISKYPQLSCFTPLLQNSSASLVKVEKYIQDKLMAIKILSDQAASKFGNARLELEELEEGVSFLLKEFSSSNVNKKCKQVKPNIFLICVNTTYKELDSKLGPLVNKIEKVRNNGETNLKELLGNTDDILRAAAIYAKEEINKINTYGEVIRSNDDFVNGTIRKYGVIINEEVTSLNCKADSVVNDVNEYFDKTYSNFVWNVTSIVTSFLGPNEQLSEYDTKFIQGFADIFNDDVNYYRNQIADYQNYAKIFDNNFRAIAFIYNERYLKEVCEYVYCNQSALAGCVNEEMLKLNADIENVVKNLNDIINKIETVTAEAGLNLINGIADLLQKANETYTIIHLDKNNPKDSAVTIALCLESINLKANEEILPKIEDIYSIPGSIRESIKKQVDDAAPLLRSVIAETLLSLDEAIQSYPSEAEKYYYQKDQLVALLQNAEEKLKNEVEGSFDRLNSVEIRIDEKQKLVILKLADLKPETLNQSCKTVFESKTNFAKCIAEECGKVKDFLKDTEKDVQVLEENSQGILQEIGIDVTKTISEETRIVLEAAEEVKEYIETMNRKKNDENNSTTSAAFISECLDSVSKKINKTLNFISAVESEISVAEVNLVKSVKEQVKAATEDIITSYGTALEAFDYIIFLNSKETAKYTKQKATLNASIDETIKRINNNVNQNLGAFAELTAEVNKIRTDLSARQAAFVQNLNKSCEAVYSLKKNYSNCIDEQCAYFKQYLNEKESNLDNLSTDTTILSFDVLKNVTSNLDFENTTAVQKLKNESETLFKENNVKEQTLLNLPLNELGRFNVTTYRNNVNLISQRAVELRNRQNSVNSTITNIYGKLGNLLSLHESAVAQICPKVSVKNEQMYAFNLLQASKNRVQPKLPNNSDFVMEQLNLATSYENLLKEQISRLQSDAVNKSCADVLNDAFKLFECVKRLVNNFGDFFKKASSEVKIEAQDALYELQNRTNVLYQYRDVNVSQETASVEVQLGPIPEQIYTGTCNATKDKVLDFAILQINNRYNRLQPILANLEKNVSNAADLVTSKNYKDVVDIQSKLNDTQDYLKIAIVAAQKKNASYVTPLSENPQNKIAIGIDKYQKFVGDILLNASIAKANAKVFLAQSETIYKNVNKTSISEACYKDNVTRPLTSFIVCNNGYAYNFDVTLTDLRVKMEDAATKLAAVNIQDGKKYVQDYADQLAADMKTASAYDAIKVYTDNGIEIPDNLKAYVKDNCLSGRTSDGKCIIYS